MGDWLEELEVYVTTVLTGAWAASGRPTAQSEGEVGKGGELAISGDVDVFTVGNAANAYIGAGAMVNQNQKFEAKYSSPNQDVEVESDTNIETINLAGQAPALAIPSLGSGAAGGEAGLGGSFQFITYNNSDHAYIDNQARVSAGGNINVNANTYNWLLNVAQSGRNSAALGVNGTVIFFNLVNDTEGWIDAGATVNAGGNVGATAGNTLTDIVAAGGLAIGGDAGVGVSGSYNNLTDTTKAFIGITGDTTLPHGSVTAGEARRSAPRRNRRSSASASRGRSSTGSSEESTEPDDGITPPTPSSDSGDEFGIGISGDVGLNFLDETTEAFINGTGTITATGAAGRDRHGYGALHRGGGRRGLRGPRRDRRFGGDRQSHHDDRGLHPEHDARGRVDGRLRDLERHAHRRRRRWKREHGGDSGSVAGSVNLNSLTSHTEAYLGDGTSATTKTGGVSIEAVNTLFTTTVAGVVAVNLERTVPRWVPRLDPGALLAHRSTPTSAGPRTVTRRGTSRFTPPRSETIISVGACAGRFRRGRRRRLRVLRGPGPHG